MKITEMSEVASMSVRIMLGLLRLRGCFMLTLFLRTLSGNGSWSNVA